MMFHKLKELITYAPFPLSDLQLCIWKKKHYEITFVENESLLVVSFALFC